MSEKPLFAAPGVVISRQIATIHGQSFAIGQIASVGLVTDRRKWRGNLLWGLGILAFAAAVVMFNSDCMFPGPGQCKAASDGARAIVSAMVALFAVLSGVILTIVGALQVMRGVVSSRAGNYLEIGMSDGRVHRVQGLTMDAARSIEAAIMQGIQMR